MIDKVLITGAGGREHALAEAMAESPHVHEIYCAPGNGGTESLAINVDIPSDAAAKLAEFCVEKSIDLAVLGPDDSIAAGVADNLREEGILVFGPSMEAGKLESDKWFAHEFMNRWRIPHPPARMHDNFEAAKREINNSNPGNMVMKARGPALGKGVYLPPNRADAMDALKEMMIEKRFGDAGAEVIFQKRISGKELSVIAVCHGQNYELLPMSQDYKRLGDDEEGPNTGGMGTVAPAEIISAEELSLIKQKIIQPTLKGMEEEGKTYSGILYTGVMLTPAGPQVIEYNSRFGDPECQALLPLIEDDIYEYLRDAASGDVRKLKINQLTSALIVLASKNYPVGSSDPQPIEGLDNYYENVEVIHAGTKLSGDSYKAVGGRVLNIIGKGRDLDEALSSAYKAIGPGKISFEGMQYRSDIGSNL